MEWGLLLSVTLALPGCIVRFGRRTAAAAAHVLSIVGLISILVKKFGELEKEKKKKLLESALTQ